MTHLSEIAEEVERAAWVDAFEAVDGRSRRELGLWRG